MSNRFFIKLRFKEAAMTAYVYIQFGYLESNLMESIKKSLLKYCELDTMAMVMIFEHFLEKN